MEEVISKYLPTVFPNERLSFLRFFFRKGYISLSIYVTLIDFVLKMDFEKGLANVPWQGCMYTSGRTTERGHEAPIPRYSPLPALHPEHLIVPIPEIREKNNSATINNERPIPRTVRKVIRRVLDTRNSPPNSTGFKGIDSEWRYYQHDKTCNHCGRQGFITPLCPYKVTKREADQYWMDRVVRNHGSYLHDALDARHIADPAINATGFNGKDSDWIYFHPK